MNLELRKKIQEILYPDGVIPLEEGCEVEVNIFGNKEVWIMTDSMRCINKNTLFLYERFVSDDVPRKNLGKPSTVGDLLRALSKKHKESLLFEYVGDICWKDRWYIQFLGGEGIFYDLSKTPETQTQEVTDQLIEILS
jgi:hypothetical protein